MGATDQIPTPELAQKCREESERYRRGRSDARGHCYELFRRAIVDRDQRAWTAVYEQYRRLVAKWVNGPPDQVDDRIHEAFERFLRAVKPQTFTNRFAGIGKVMAYLRVCARSVRVEKAREDDRRERAEGLWQYQADVVGRQSDSPDEQALEHVLSQELSEHIEQCLNDEQERLVVHLSFKVGLMPRQIAQEHPDRFANVEEVRRVKERVVLRLSSDPRLQSWWKNQIRLGKNG